MNKLLDNGLVALALIASAGYALSSLGPKTLRRQLWTALARLAARVPPGMHLGGIARRLAEAAAKSSAACGGCGSCGSTSDEAPLGRAPEVRVPLESIGKRGQNGRAPENQQRT